MVDFPNDRAICIIYTATFISDYNIKTALHNTFNCVFLILSLFFSLIPYFPYILNKQRWSTLWHVLSSFDFDICLSLFLWYMKYMVVQAKHLLSITISIYAYLFFMKYMLVHNAYANKQDHFFYMALYIDLHAHIYRQGHIITSKCMQQYDTDDERTDDEPTDQAHEAIDQAPEPTDQEILEMANNMDAEELTEAKKHLTSICAEYEHDIEWKEKEGRKRITHFYDGFLDIDESQLMTRYC